MSETVTVGGFEHWQDADGIWWWRDHAGAEYVATTAACQYLDALAARERALAEARDRFEQELVDTNCLVDEWRSECAKRERELAEARGWEDSARHFADSAEFYRGIVRQIGEGFGVAARTSDDGSVQDDVLALKVPELVDALRADLAAVEAVERWGRGEDCEVTWHRDGTVSAMMHVDDGFLGRCDTVTTAPTLAALGRALLAREADDAQ